MHSFGKKAVVLLALLSLMNLIGCDYIVINNGSKYYTEDAPGHLRNMTQEGEGSSSKKILGLSWRDDEWMIIVGVLGALFAVGVAIWFVNSLEESRNNSY